MPTPLHPLDATTGAYGLLTLSVVIAFSVQAALVALARIPVAERTERSRNVVRTLVPMVFLSVALVGVLLARISLSGGLEKIELE